MGWEKKMKTKSKKHMALFAAAVAAALGGISGKAKADSFTDVTATGSWNTSRWNSSADGPTYTSAYTANANVTFSSGTYSIAGMGATINVGNITVASGVTVNFTSAANTFATNGAVRTINVGSGGTFNLAGQAISTTAGTGFNKTGAGTMIITSGAAYSSFTLTAGTMIAGGVNALGNGALNLNGGILSVNSSSNRDFTGKFTSITIGGNVQFGDSVNVSAGTGTMTFSNNMDLGAASRTLTLGNNETVVFGGVISNTATNGLTFAATAGGTGRIDVTNTANTFTGNLTVTGGEVRFTAAGSFGNANNNIIIDGGRLATLSGASYTLASTHAIFIGDTTGTSISTPGSGVLTYNGVMTDITGKVGSWAKQGGGTLALGGQSNYSGNTAINNGFLQLTTGSDRLPTGTVVSLGQAASANIGTFDLNGQNQQIAGLVSTAGTNSTASKNTVTSATAATLTISGNGTYSYGDGTTQNSGIITGAIALVKTGVGSQTFADANTYTGGTTVTNGNLTVNTGGTIGASTGNLGVSAANGVTTALYLNVDQTVGNLTGTVAGTGTATITIGSGNTLTVNQSANTTFAGAIAGSGGKLTKNGTGSLTLSGTHSYTGATTITQGTLNVTGSLNSGSAVSVSGTLSGNGTVGGAVTVNATGKVAPGSVGVGSITIGSGLDMSAASANYIWELGALSTSGPGTNFDQINLSGGAMTIGSGATLTLDFTLLSSALRPGGGDAFWTTSEQWKIIDVNGSSSGNFTAANIALINGTLTQGTFSTSTGTGGNAGDIFLNFTPGSTSLFWNGSGNWVSAGPGAGGSGTWANATGSWDPSKTAIFSGTAGAVAVTAATANKGITFSTTGYTVSGGTITLSSTGTNNVITADSNVTATISSALSTSAGIIKAGTGTLILNSVQSYTGGTTVNLGTLQLGDGTSNNGTVAGDIANAAAVVFANPTSLTYAGVISGIGNVTVAGPGNLNLTGTSTYSGGTTITGGTLTLGHASDTLKDTGAVTVSGGTLALGNNSDTVGAVTVTSGNITGTGGTLTATSYAVSNSSGTSTISANLAGAGGLIKTNAGSVTLSGTNTYLGNTTINGGTITVASESNLGDSAASLIFGNGTLATTGDLATARAITVNAAGGTIAHDVHSFSTSAATTIGGVFTTTGSGDVALNGTDTFTSGGSLNIGSGGSVTLGQAAGTIDMSNGGTFAGSLVITNAIRVNFNTGTFSGAGQIQVKATASSIADSGSAVSSTIGSNISLNPGGSDPTAFTTNIGATSGNTLTILGGISGAASVNFAVGSSGGAGVLILGGSGATASTYTGATAITNSGSGTIQLGMTDALPTGTAVTFAATSGTLDLHGFNQTIASLASGASSVGKIANKSTALASDVSTLTISGDTTPGSGFSGVIQDGSTTGNGGVFTHLVAVVKDGSNTLSLTGSNTYTGGTTILNGTLSIATSGAHLAAAGAVTVNGGIFDLGAFDETVGAVTLTNGSITGTGTLTGSSFDVRNGTI